MTTAIHLLDQLLARTRTSLGALQPPRPHLVAALDRLVERQRPALLAMVEEAFAWHLKRTSPPLPPQRGLHWSGVSLEPPQPANTRQPLFSATRNELGQPPELRQVAPRVDDGRIIPRRKRGTQWIWSPTKPGIYLAFWPWAPAVGEQAAILRLERGVLTLVEHIANRDPDHLLLFTALDRARLL